MSRTGKVPVSVPDTVEIALEAGVVHAKGKRGTLSYAFGETVDVALKENQIMVAPKGSHRQARSIWGTARSRIDNIVRGVSEGFSKTLDINGVGYRVEVKGGALELQLGYSHPITFPIPEGIEIQCPKPVQVVVSGADKQKVGQVAADIRALRKPEPYKGKGIQYADERILRKEGKKK